MAFEPTDDHKNHAVDLYNSASDKTKQTLTTHARNNNHSAIADWIENHPRTAAAVGVGGINFLGLAVYLAKKLR